MAEQVSTVVECNLKFEMVVVDLGLKIFPHSDQDRNENVVKMFPWRWVATEH